MKKVMYRVAYKRPGMTQWATCLARDTLDEAIAQESRILDAKERGTETRVDRVEVEITSEVKVPNYGTCHKCGRPKVAEMFKGIYCSWCNDWC